ncbi:MAG: HAMP domain-containing histidine kinase [Magnetococcales bacterium]|nr:HAMP domain-containing histidine kinase [Magnetococcales bacterium]
MKELSDDELIKELKKRFDTTKKALYDVRIITKKLEDMNRKLRASEQIKSSFVSLVKNEINNPLTSILGLSEQLRSGRHSQETINTIADMIHQESFTLDFQLRNIFITAELESGEADMQVASVNVEALINDAVESFQHLIKEKQLKYDLQVEGGCAFKTDPEKLSLIISNLLSNAVGFNNVGGRIAIRVAVVDNILNLSVQDSGIGIDPNRISRLFDRFYQSDSGVRKLYKGHGLGLAVIKALLDLMGGTIRAESPEGGGSTFSITLPPLPSNADSNTFSVDGSEFLFDDNETSEIF